jgi:death-on-curing protein
VSVPNYLTAEDVWALNQRMLAGEGRQSIIIDRGKLEAAVMRPQNLAHYEQADLIDQAATLIIGIALAHAFLDANKRTAALAGEVFLNDNGHHLIADNIDYGVMILEIVDATDRPASEAQFRHWLRGHVL